MIYELELKYKALEFNPKYISSFYDTLDEAKIAMEDEIDTICNSYFKSYPALKGEWQAFKKGMGSNNLYIKNDLYGFLRVPNGSVYEWRIKNFYN